MINVWITEKNKNIEPYCLVERADDRSEAIEALNQAILTDGVVPSWVTSVDFYERGDQPTETYQAGDTIPDFKGDLVTKTLSISDLVQRHEQ